MPLQAVKKSGVFGTLAKVLSGANLGIDAYVVEVEVDIAQGLPGFAVRGPSGRGLQGSRGTGEVRCRMNPETSAIKRVLGRKDCDEVSYRNNLARTGKGRSRK